MNVIVCGGGIAGLTVALFLKKKGYACQVFEAKADKLTTTSGINLSPSGTNVLADLGLAARLQKRAQVIRQMRMLNSEGTVFAELEFKGKEQYGQDYLSVTRRALHEILLSEAKALDIPIHYNMKLISLRQDAQRVVASFANGNMVQGDLFIGADGIHSAARHSLFPELQLDENKKRGYFGCGIILPLNYLTPEEVSLLRLNEGGFNSISGSLGFVGFIGVGEGKFMFWSHIAEADVPPGFDCTDMTQVKEVLLSLRGSWCPPTRKTIELIDSKNADIAVMCEPIVSLNSIPKWSEKRVVLIGDAAHGFGPGAQGAAMAMEDASLLVRMISQCKDNRAEAWSDVFQRFEARRRPRVEQIGVSAESRNDSRLVDNGFIRTKLKEYGMRLVAWWYRDGYYDANVDYRVENDLN